MSQMIASTKSRTFPAAALGLILAIGPLSACSTVEKGWRSTKDAVGGLFSSSDDEKAAPPAEETAATPEPTSSTATTAPTGGGGLFMGNSEVAGKFKSAAPAPAAVEKPKAVTEPPKKRTIEGLVADNAKVEYSDQGGRQAPVTVRPLNENPSQADASSTGGPPRPQAAPTERVTRLAEVPPAAPAATPAAPASSANAAPAAQAPRTAALAERLNAPAPTAAAPAPTPLAPAPAPMTAAPKSVQPLIPSASSISSYDSDTVVIDGSGVRGGRKGVGQQLASAPRASFDPGNASVSSEVGTVSFGYGSSALSGKAKAMLADVAKLRAQVDGAIRIVGRGDQAQARAAAISRELRRLGVPSARLYDGGADNTLLGDEADIYVDY